LCDAVNLKRKTTFEAAIPAPALDNHHYNFVSENVPLAGIVRVTSAV
jgi:hypothetical protein